MPFLPPLPSCLPPPLPPYLQNYLISLYLCFLISSHPFLFSPYFSSSFLFILIFLYHCTSFPPYPLYFFLSPCHIFLLPFACLPLHSAFFPFTLFTFLPFFFSPSFLSSCSLIRFDSPLCLTYSLDFTTFFFYFLSLDSPVLVSPSNSPSSTHLS